MNINEIKNSIANGDFSQSFATLYPNDDSVVSRYCEACDEFKKLYGDGEIRIFSAPGRTEIGGNHTDHQHGCVLAGSVDMDVIAISAKNSGNEIKIKSKGYPEDTVCIDDLEPKKEEEGTAISLIRGIAGEFSKRGYKVGGFFAYTTSNVLKGSGLSSSAAFEIVVCVMLNYLYNDGKISPVEMAVISQIAENDYYKKPCGLMDQMASSVGSFIGIDFFDNSNPVIEKIDFDPAKYGYKLCIVNTGGNHTDLTDDYAAITTDCKNVSNYLGVEHLRYADQGKFYDNIADIRQKFGDRAVLRAMHFFYDNDRVGLQENALKNGDIKEFFNLITESGNSSYKLLQNVFSCKAPTEQGIPLALALTEKYLSGEGAVRVHGGGFAGTIQAFVPEEKLNGYVDMIEKTFGKGNCYVLNIRPVGGCEVTKNR